MPPLLHPYWYLQTQPLTISHLDDHIDFRTLSLPILTSPNLSNFESLKNFPETKKNEDNITILLKTHQYTLSPTE